jgi:hypothetical protein
LPDRYVAPPIPPEAHRHLQGETHAGHVAEVRWTDQAGNRAHLQRAEEVDMSDQDDWQAQQQHDLEQMHRTVLEALQASLERPLTKDEAMALAWSAGLANDFYKEIRA